MGQGYRKINVVRRTPGKKFDQVKIAIMVLETFVGPRPLGMDSCHTNDVKTDDRLINLRWDTPRENQLDLVRNGKHWEARQVTCQRGHNDWTLRKSGKRLCRPCRRLRQNGTDDEKRGG